MCELYGQAYRPTAFFMSTCNIIGVINNIYRISAKVLKSTNFKVSKDLVCMNDVVRITTGILSALDNMIVCKPSLQQPKDPKLI